MMRRKRAVSRWLIGLGLVVLAGSLLVALSRSELVPFAPAERLTGTATNERNVQLLAAPDGTLHAVFEKDLGPVLGYGVMYMNHSGATGWSTPVPIPSPDPNNNVNPALARDAAGVIHVVFENQDTHKIYHSRNDLGGQFRPAQLVHTLTGTTAARPQVRVDAYGTVHVAFVDEVPGTGTRNVYYRNRTVAGWSTPFNVSRSANDANHPALALRDAFPTPELHFAWQQDDGDAEVFVANRTSAGFSAPVNLTWNDEADARPRVAVNGTGGVHLAWQATRGGTDHVTYGNSSDGCTWVLTNVTTGTRPDLAINATGGIHLAWVGQQPGGDLEIVHGAQLPGGFVAGTFTNVSANGEPDAAPRVAFDAANVLHVAWLRTQAHDYVHYGHAATPAPQVTDLDPNGVVVSRTYPRINATLTWYVDAPLEWAAWARVNTTTPVTLNLTRDLVTPGNYYATWTNASAYPNGDYNVTVVAWDGYQYNATESCAFTLNYTAPVATSVRPANDTHVTHTPICVNATFESAVGVAGARVTINTSTSNPVTLPMEYRLTPARWEACWTNNSLYPNGWYNASITVWDLVGATNDTIWTVFHKTSDFVAPTVTRVAPPTGTNVSAWPFVVEVDATDNRGVVSDVKLRVNASTPFWVDGTTQDGTTWTCTWANVSAYPAAWYNFTVHAWDPWVNENASQSVVLYRHSVHVDGTPPAVVGFHPANGTVVACCPVEFNCTVNDASAIHIARVTLNATPGPVVLPLAPVQGMFYRAYWLNCSSYGAGTYLATVEVVDAVGNVRSHVYEFQVARASCGPGTPGTGTYPDGTGDGTPGSNTTNGTTAGESGRWYPEPLTIPGPSPGWLGVAMGSGTVLVVGQRWHARRKRSSRTREQNLKEGDALSSLQ